MMDKKVRRIVYTIFLTILPVITLNTIVNYQLDTSVNLSPVVVPLAENDSLNDHFEVDWDGDHEVKIRFLTEKTDGKSNSDFLTTMSSFKDSLDVHWIMFEYSHALDTIETRSDLILSVTSNPMESEQYVYNDYAFQRFKAYSERYYWYELKVKALSNNLMKYSPQFVVQADSPLFMKQVAWKKYGTITFAILIPLSLICIFGIVMVNKKRKQIDGGLQSHYSPATLALVQTR